MSARESVAAEPAFILHQRPYLNSSQLLECLTFNHGRIGLVARGSKRPRSGLRAILQPFGLLALSWVRRGELGQLTAAESMGAPALHGTAVMAGYYVNELMLRLTRRDDPNEILFAEYRECLDGLAATNQLARQLRTFEFRLLQALGFGLQLELEAGAQVPVVPESRYRYDPASGPWLVDQSAQDDATFSGAELINIRNLAFSAEPELRAARRLLRLALAVHLGPEELKTRRVLRSLSARGLSL